MANVAAQLSPLSRKGSLSKSLEPPNPPPLSSEGGWLKRSWKRSPSPLSDTVLLRDESSYSVSHSVWCIRDSSDS